MTPSSAMAELHLNASDSHKPNPEGPVGHPVGDGRVLSMGCATVVLLPIVHHHADRSPEAVQRQRESAREALRLCAVEGDAPTDGWTQRPDGAPLSNDGWYWSISHKRRWACAALSRGAVGIDIEEIAARRVPLYDKVGSDEEWAMLGGRTWPAFFRLWTTKEATLKANGVGIGAMDDCRLKRVTDDCHSVATYLNNEWQIEHTAIDNHTVAVATPS